MGSPGIRPTVFCTSLYCILGFGGLSPSHKKGEIMKSIFIGIVLLASSFALAEPKITVEGRADYSIISIQVPASNRLFKQLFTVFSQSSMARPQKDLVEEEARSYQVGKNKPFFVIERAREYFSLDIYVYNRDFYVNEGTVGLTGDTADILWQVMKKDKSGTVVSRTEGEEKDVEIRGKNSKETIECSGSPVIPAQCSINIP